MKVIGINASPRKRANTQIGIKGTPFSYLVLADVADGTEIVMSPKFLLNLKNWGRPLNIIQNIGVRQGIFDNGCFRTRYCSQVRELPVSSADNRRATGKSPEAQ